jgi:hexosaminidase
MRSLVKLVALLAGAGVAALAAEPALMPMPVTMTAASGTFLVNTNFVVDTTGSGNAARLKPVVSWFLARIQRQTGVPLTPQPPAAADAKTLKIQCAGGPAYPSLGEDESYTLDVSDAGATIKSATVEGAIHGLATFAQLIVPGPDGFQVAGVHIADKPRYQWRGLMLDVCRHWMPAEVVERNLDAMAAVKMNVLHWHLSEDQGFRVESKKYPKLQEMGSDGAYYTQDQIKEIVEYARNRGIRVVPEFDVPGHTGAWFIGYPELASRPGPFTLGGRGGGGAMDPTKDSTYAFLDGFIGEMVTLFPDPYWHVGGDEVSGNIWTSNPDIAAFMKDHNIETAQALQVYFNQRLLKIVQKYNRTMMGWDEILAPGLPTDAVIHSWRDQRSLYQAAVEGHRAVMSWGYYLDHLSPASYHYGIDPLTPAPPAPNGRGAQATPPPTLTPEQETRIMGGEACMWAELVGPNTVDSRVWPRTAAIAERLWSPKEVNDVDSMYARLAVVSRNLEFTGVTNRTYYQPMLDRLAGDQPSGPVKVVADASEALGLGTGRNGRPGVWGSFNRFVDAVPADSELVHSMELAAKRLLANPTGDKDDASMLRVQFQTWADNDAKFEALAADNALLKEVMPVSKNLSALGATGLKMLDYLTTNQPAPADWLTEQNTAITGMARPAGRGGGGGGGNRPAGAPAAAGAAAPGAPAAPGATPAAGAAPGAAPAAGGGGRGAGGQGGQGGQGGYAGGGVGGRGGAGQNPSADVNLAAVRPVKLLADALAKK